MNLKVVSHVNLKVVSQVFSFHHWKKDIASGELGDDFQALLAGQRRMRRCESALVNGALPAAEKDGSTLHHRERVEAGMVVDGRDMGHPWLAGRLHRAHAGAPLRAEVAVGVENLW